MNDVNRFLQQQIEEAEDQILGLQAMVFHLYTLVAESGTVASIDMVKALTYEANRLEQQFPNSPKVTEYMDSLWKSLNEKSKS